MKSIKYIATAVTALVIAVACDDFLTREPINSYTSISYFSSETELKMYTDGMINSYIPSYSGVGLADGDVYSDLIGTKASSDFYHPNQWDDTQQGSWSWTFARRVNYMLENMDKAKDAVSEEVYNHYEGVARFWRAYYYQSRVRSFSDVPWLPYVVEYEDTATLYASRDDREYVWHQIVEDLSFACENCLASSAYNTDGRVYINKYVALAYASRYCLYEGTYRLYHDVNPSTNVAWNNNYETAQDLIQMAADYAAELIETGAFSLHDDYSELFLSESLPTDEVIWGRSYSDDLGVRHDLTRYYNSSTLGQQYSGTKPLVQHYLTTDGTPVATNGYVSDPDGNIIATNMCQSILDEFDGRDTRLGATVLGPGHQVLALSGDYEDQAPNFTYTKTGYMLVKWCVPDATHFQNSIDVNCIPIMRYAEVLLNYAEAKKLLGEMTEDVWDLTIGALRERAGVKSIYPGSSDYVEDPFLISYYTENVENPPSWDNVYLEIVRERATELVLENGLRMFDLYRWHLADIIVRRTANPAISSNGSNVGPNGWSGLWVSTAEKSSGFTMSGTTYTFSGSSTSDTNYTIADTGANLTWGFMPTYSNSAGTSVNGYLLMYYYTLDFQEYMYVRPIPQSAYLLNPNLLPQNYGWEQTGSVE